MKKVLLVELVAALVLTGCMWGTGPHGSGAVIMVPALPTIVVLDSGPYYQHGGYHYHYQGDRWYYSRSRSGPWEDLPRDRYPKEVKFKGKGGDQGQGGNQGRGGGDRGRGGDDRGRGDDQGQGDDQSQGKKKGHDKD